MGRPLRGGVSGAAATGQRGHGAHTILQAPAEHDEGAPRENLTFSAGACVRARSPTAAHARTRRLTPEIRPADFPPGAPGRRGGVSGGRRAAPRDAGARPGSTRAGAQDPPSRGGR